MTRFLRWLWRRWARLHVDEPDEHALLARIDRDMASYDFANRVRHAEAALVRRYHGDGPSDREGC